MPPRKRLSADAEQVAVYLTPEEQLVLDTIRARRKKRSEVRTSASEIVADGLWHILVEKEGVSRELIRALTNIGEARESTNIKPFLKP